MWAALGMDKLDRSKPETAEALLARIKEMSVVVEKKA